MESKEIKVEQIDIKKMEKRANRSFTLSIIFLIITIICFVGTVITKISVSAIADEQIDDTTSKTALPSTVNPIRSNYSVLEETEFYHLYSLETTNIDINKQYEYALDNYNFDLKVIEKDESKITYDLIINGTYVLKDTYIIDSTKGTLSPITVAVYNKTLVYIKQDNTNHLYFINEAGKITNEINTINPGSQTTELKLTNYTLSNKGIEITGVKYIENYGTTYSFCEIEDIDDEVFYTATYMYSFDNNSIGDTYTLVSSNTFGEMKTTCTE